MAIGLVRVLHSPTDDGFIFPVKWVNGTPLVSSLNKCVDACATVYDPLAYLLTSEERRQAMCCYSEELNRLVAATCVDTEQVRLYAADPAAAAQKFETILNGGGVHSLWVREIDRLAADTLAKNYAVGLRQPSKIFRLQRQPLLAEDSAVPAPLGPSDWRMFVEAVLCRAALERTNDLPNGASDRANAQNLGTMRILTHRYPHFAPANDGDQTPAHLSWRVNIDTAARAYNDSLS